MPISINPVFPVIAAQAAAPEVTLQPGTVIEAEVLKILANDLVRIAIANLSIEVLSEIPLQVGQTLQLAVSQTSAGIRLAVIGQGGRAGSDAVLVSGSSELVVPEAASPDIVDIAPVTAGQTPTDAEPLQKQLTPMQTVAIAAAAQTAATRQNSLAPLFANLGTVTQSEVLPPQLQQTVTQLLTLRPTLDQNLNADVVENAFHNSGLFLESSLASGRTLPSSAGVPDLKAALLVLRQTLQSLDMAVPEVASPATAAPLQPASPQQATLGMLADSASERPVAASPSLAPAPMPEIEVEEVFLPQARLPVAEDFSESNAGGPVPSAAQPPQAARTGAAIVTATPNALQEVSQAIPQKTVRPERPAPDENLPPDPLRLPNAPRPAVRDDDAAAVHPKVPPPPFRGALPSAQPVAPASLTPDAPLAAIVRRLSVNTDAAIARQTLLQIASLPDRTDLAGLRTDPGAPRWNFEIPFSIPAGTAVAQFEIARDGAGSKAEAVKPVWRARFSLDVEPAGPVHASISLTGDRMSVRMWAERPATVTQLRAGMSRLSQALSRAELQPGDIVVRHGAPAQQAPAPAGYFLDRAL
jgi:hypothetical protein